MSAQNVLRPDRNGEAVSTCFTCTWAPRYDALSHQLDIVIGERDALQQEFRRIAAENAKLRKERDAALQETDMAEPATEVYEYWRDVIEGGSRRVRNTAKRSKAVQARLNEGRSVEELKLAIDGAKIGAYVDEKGVRHDDLELICRDDGKVRRFIQIAQQHALAVDREHSVLAQLLVARFGHGACRRLDVKWSSHAELWPCPVCDWEGRFPGTPSAPQSLCMDYDARYARCMTCQSPAVRLIDALRNDPRRLRSVAA